MTDLQMWSLLVGSFLPPLVAIIQQPRWSDRVRATVSIVSSLIAGGGTVLLAGELTGKTLMTSVLLVAITSWTAYKNFWKPTGVAPAVEKATVSEAVFEPKE